MKCKVLTFLEYHSTGAYPMWFNSSFKDFHKGLNREWYRVDDVDLWFESDMEEGSTLIKHRVGVDARYGFRKVYTVHVE